MVQLASGVGQCQALRSLLNGLSQLCTQSLEAERAAAIIAALQQEAASIRAEQERQAASQTERLASERAAKQRLADELDAAKVCLAEKASVHIC